ncbi:MULTISPECIES: helix-turn-helix domain-containing protein [Bifidobacterium]|uniref:Helix-turn-helix domain-containing protein n=2 Tax=Bifidobacterium TaxID=1678 RepID=A0A087DMX6_9BIFI|nr:MULTISPECIES: helix-turn-helix domain-containing protein [Bifidobacterium]KFI96876.1 hypothetical protein BSTEL_1785 [Bifidobacterium stellenboschense]NEG89117.1 helix-turn-helix domain-containing protein [Bifidobacterium aerophilum]
MTRGTLEAYRQDDSTTTGRRRTLYPGLEPLSVTVAEATRLLGFRNCKSVYRLIREGRIKARKSGHIFLISYRSLKEYVEG